MKSISIFEETIHDLKNNKIGYIEMIENEDFWEVVHSYPDLFKFSKMPFINSFDEYSVEWFYMIKEDFIAWIERIIFLLKTNCYTEN